MLLKNEILLLFTTFLFETSNHITVAAFQQPERMIFFKPPSTIILQQHDSINITLEAKRTLSTENEIAEYDYEYEDEGLKFGKAEDNYTILNRKSSSSSLGISMPKLNRILSFTFLAFFVFAFLCLLAHCLFKNHSSRVGSSASSTVISRDGNLILCRHNRIRAGAGAGGQTANLILGVENPSQRMENAYGATYPLAPSQNLVSHLLSSSSSPSSSGNFKLEMPPPYEKVQSSRSIRRLGEERATTSTSEEATSTSVHLQINEDSLPQHPPPYVEEEEEGVKSDD